MVRDDKKCLTGRALEAIVFLELLRSVRVESEDNIFYISWSVGQTHALLGDRFGNEDTSGQRFSPHADKQSPGPQHLVMATTRSTEKMRYISQRARGLRRTYVICLWALSHYVTSSWLRIACVMLRPHALDWIGLVCPHQRLLLNRVMYVRNA